MSNIRNEILELDRMIDNHVYSMTSRNGKVRAFLAKSHDYQGVALENINMLTINEKFVNVHVKNMEFEVNNVKIPVIYLYSSKDVELKEFAFMAEHFLSLVNEDEIINEPLNWVNDWKNMLGDSKKKLKVYDIIGELVSFKYVYSQDNKAHWQASEYGVHDIESPTSCFEIKSTIKREEAQVTISSAFQLVSNKIESLLFCRFEKDITSALNINNIVKDIVNLGYSEEMIEDELSKLGYPSGMSSRNIGYNLLEIREYSVTKDNFPIISLDSINSLGPKNNIIGFKLDLDLSGLEYKKIV